MTNAVANLAEELRSLSLEAGRSQSRTEDLKDRSRVTTATPGFK